MDHARSADDAVVPAIVARVGRRTREDGAARSPTGGARGPLGEVDIEAAARSFAERFVVSHKRERAQMVLSSARRRRGEILGAEPWLDPGFTLAPAQVGAVIASASHRVGVLFTREACARATLGDALQCSGSEDALFVADDGRLAVYFFEVGDPTVCVAPGH